MKHTDRLTAEADEIKLMHELVQAVYDDPTIPLQIADKIEAKRQKLADKFMTEKAPGL
jgi:hypothetical protein